MIDKAFGLLLGTVLSASAMLSGAHAADKVKLKMAEVVRSQFYVPMYVALSKGFTTVYWFRGGFPEWEAAGFPIEATKDQAVASGATQTAAAKQ